VLRVLSAARNADVADRFHNLRRAGRRVSEPNEKAADRGSLAH
jgi:hypothetical protein